MLKSEETPGTHDSKWIYILNNFDKPVFACCNTIEQFPSSEIFLTLHFKSGSFKASYRTAGKEAVYFKLFSTYRSTPGA